MPVLLEASSQTMPASQASQGQIQSIRQLCTRPLRPIFSPRLIPPNQEHSPRSVPRCPLVTSGASLEATQGTTRQSEPAGFAPYGNIS